METLKSPQTSKTLILLLFLLSPLSFFLGNQWSYSTTPIPFFSQTLTQTISISPNANLTLDPHSLFPSPPPPPITFGVVDSNGAMTDDFRVGTFEKDPVLEKDQEKERRESRVRVGAFRRCEDGMKEWIPCLDNVEEIRSSSSRGERFERRCPEKKVRCLVPAPKDYKSSIPWPRSRDEVWYSNVPHTRLVDDKGGQNWIKKDKDKFKFPGGGTQFIHGADQYLNQISEMVPDIAFGRHTRVALDVGCGVASFGAFLLSRNVITLSIAPKDVHENQIQFALERGVPAMVAAFATRRLPYPNSAFDLIHCSRCRIDWLDDGGILLLEVNRMLRPGGYFAWAAQPVYKHEEAQQEAWKEMEKLTANICWELVKKEGYIAIWRKPLNNSCYTNRETGAQPPMCDAEDDPDMVWYMDLKPCITLIPENGSGANVSVWPNRLHYPPDRLQGVVMDAYISKKELFRAESLYWKDIVGSYVRAFHWKNLKLRNVMDMRAGFGGFAAALIDHNVDCWVMNVVPISGPNTLPVIYDRGLIGVSHDWCEPFDTYPRTYDLLHAAGLFSIEHKRCKITDIILEMDRILRPDGRAYIRDTRPIIDEIKYITDAMRWKCRLGDTEEGPYSSRSVLMCQKLLLRS